MEHKEDVLLDGPEYDVIEVRAHFGCSRIPCNRIVSRQIHRIQRHFCLCPS